MPIPIKAGELFNNVQLFDVPGDAQDSYGQASETGTLIGTFRAKVQNLKGRELIAAQQAYTSVTHKVTMRWLGPLIPATTHNPNRLILPRMYLILEDGSRLDIVNADNVDKLNFYWVLTCNEKVLS